MHCFCFIPCYFIFICICISVCVSKWPHRSNPQRLSCSSSSLLRDDWQLSCLHRWDWYLSEVISLTEDEKSLLIQESAHCSTASVRCKASPTGEWCLCRRNYVCINSFYILSSECTICIKFFLLLFVCIALYCDVWSCLYYCKCNVNTVMIINFNNIIGKKDKPVIYFCIKLLFNF